VLIRECLCLALFSLQIGVDLGLVPISVTVPIDFPI
jgi:hypothetical protein